MSHQVLSRRLGEGPKAVRGDDVLLRLAIWLAEESAEAVVHATAAPSPGRTPSVPRRAMAAKSRPKGSTR
jgi:hypothetical protein